jgi:hypothetical protein
MPPVETLTSRSADPSPKAERFHRSFPPAVIPAAPDVHGRKRPKSSIVHILFVPGDSVEEATVLFGDRRISFDGDHVPIHEAYHRILLRLIHDWETALKVTNEAPGDSWDRVSDVLSKAAQYVGVAKSVWRKARELDMDIHYQIWVTQCVVKFNLTVRKLNESLTNYINASPGERKPKVAQVTVAREKPKFTEIQICFQAGGIFDMSRKLRQYTPHEEDPAHANDDHSNRRRADLLTSEDPMRGIAPNKGAEARLMPYFPRRNQPRVSHQEVANLFAITERGARDILDDATADFKNGVLKYGLTREEVCAAFKSNLAN